jgi:hypothetical protein
VGILLLLTLVTVVFAIAHRYRHEGIPRYRTRYSQNPMLAAADERVRREADEERVLLRDRGRQTDDAAGDGAHDETGDGETTVLRTSSVAEAALLRGLLAAQGIPSVAPASSSHPEVVPPHLVVRVRDYERARTVLAEARATPAPD